MTEERYPKGKGRKEYLDYRAGKKLTPVKAGLAKCYECSSFYLDGLSDCETPSCPLYSYMPYAKKNQRSDSSVANS